MNLRYYRDSVQRHGLGATIHHAVYRAANHLVEVAVWDAIAITRATLDESFLRREGGIRGRMIEAAAMRPYVADPENQLTDAFIDEATARGDRCYVLFDGDDIVNYGWYSTRPMRLTEVRGAPVLHYDPSYAYMYHTFTRPEHRGRRLNNLCIAAALDDWTRAGFSGLVAYIVSSNHASLKSCTRMGFQTFGHVIVLTLGAHQRWSVTPGCEKYGLRIEAATT